MLRCLSSEVIRVSKLEEVETALKPFKDYWTAQGFECEKQVSKGGVDVVAYFYDCGIYGDFLARSGRVVLSENIVTDYATEDENTEPEPVDEDAKIENLCKDYGYGAKLEYYGEGYYSCDANDSYDTKVETLEELKEKLDSLKAYWDAQGWECVFKHHLLSGGYEHDGFASHQLSWECQPKVEDEYNYVYAVHTPKVAIDSPCGFMGKGAKFKDYNLSCSCGDTYEEVNGKCQKASCKKNEFFDDDDKKCKRCPGNQRSEAGENVCSSFECPTDYQEAKEHMCLWKTTDTELIDDYGPNGLKLELKSFQDGIRRIRQDDEYFKSCNCSAEDGTPHMLYSYTDYIRCYCKDEKGQFKTFRFSFTDLSDWDGK